MGILTRKDIQFSELCEQTARIFSTCAKRQYSAVIVDDKNRIVGLGYNGTPRGWDHCVDGACPRLQENSASGSSYQNCVSIHAEANAIINSVGYGETLYVNGPPCWDCAKLIVNYGIQKLVYKRDESYKDFVRVHEFLTKNNVRCFGITTHAG